MTTSGQKRRMSATKRADALFSKIVRASGPCRAAVEEKDHTCAGAKQAAHVHSRRYRSIRWSFDNCVPLCQGAHVFYTHRPLEWEDACRRWGIDWDNLRYCALNDPPEKPDAALERLSLVDLQDRGQG
jgi:hypothetical protein